LDSAAIRRTLDAGLRDLDLPLTEEQRTLLTDFLGLLSRWNRTWNLTAITDPREMVARHLIDSLSVLDLLSGHRVLDVGSGAGLPGIPLAVASPDREFVLLDSNGKRTRFMTHAAGRLGLANISVVRSRVEDYHDESGFDTVISRAFASLTDFVLLSGHLCAPTGRLVAMKGRSDVEETSRVPAGWVLEEIRPLKVPGVEGQRHAIVLGRGSGTLD
jgi:16S rRNA (guanine527-N7)-methyltransferase